MPIPRKKTARASPEPRPSARLDLARLGEKRAAEFFESIGYKIVAKNWRSRDTKNEIDLVVEDGRCLVFVEVKTARTLNYGDPITWITPRKQAAIVRAAKSYLAMIRPTHDEFRFDTITITPPLKKDEVTLVHTKNAFYARES